MVKQLRFVNTAICMIRASLIVELAVPVPASTTTVNAFNVIDLGSSHLVRRAKYYLVDLLARTPNKTLTVMVRTDVAAASMTKVCRC